MWQQHKQLSNHSLEILLFSPISNLRNSDYFHFYVSSENSFTYFIHSFCIITLFQIFIFQTHSMNKPAFIYQRWHCDIRDPAGFTTQEPMIWVLPGHSFQSLNWLRDSYLWFVHI